MLKEQRFNDGTISFQVKVFSQASTVIVRPRLIALTLRIKLILLAILHQQYVD
jgi:hypothetical protein